jgi:hypothetical protein
VVIEDGGQWHCRQRFSQETMGRTGVSPIHQHEVDQPAMLVDGPEQVLPVATDLHIRLVHSPRGRTVPLLPANPLLKLRRVAKLQTLSSCGEGRGVGIMEGILC